VGGGSTTGPVSMTTEEGTSAAPYGGPCTTDEDCENLAICLSIGGPSMCSSPCTEVASPSDECPPSPGGSAIPTCISVLGMDLRCVLSCEAERMLPCPDGMVCEDSVVAGFFCFWP